MESRELTKWERWLTDNSRFIGGWKRRHAAAKLAADVSAEATRVLAQIGISSADPRVSEMARRAFQKLRDASAIDAVCGVWADARSDLLAQILIANKWIATAPTELRVLTALKSAQLKSLEAGGVDTAYALIDALDDSDADICRNASTGLTQLKSIEAIDAFCACWYARRGDQLTDILKSAGFRATTPPILNVCTGLKQRAWEALSREGATTVPFLVDACEDRDPEISTNAQQALRNLKTAEAKDALCRVVIERDLPSIREICLTANFLPRESHQRAVYFVLTDQWEKYQSLDFDHRLLAMAYETADTRIRSRIVEKTRQAGRTEWLSVVSGGRLDRRLSGMATDEWESVITVLSENQRWSDLWRIGQAAPAIWAARIVRQLAHNGWLPDAKDHQEELKHLSTIVANCSDRPPVFGRLMNCERKFEGHTDRIGSLIVGARRDEIISGACDNTIRVWDFDGKDSVRTLLGHEDWVSCVALSPDESILASGGPEGVVRIWKLPDGKPLKALGGTGGAIRCLAISPEGKILASGGADGKVRLWQIPDGVLMRILEGHSDVITCMSFSPNGNVLATGSQDNTARLWKIPSGESQMILEGHRTMIHCLAFTPDSRILATGSNDRTVLLWELPAGHALRRLKGHKDDVLCMAISPEGKILASGSMDGTLRLWSLPTGEFLASLGTVGTMDGHTGWVLCCCFSKDGRTLASAGLDNTIRLWDVAEASESAVLEGHEERVTAIGFGNDGQRVVSASWDRTIRVWKSELGRLSLKPISQTTASELAWVQESTWNNKLSATERAWLDLLRRLMRWRRRHDIQLGDQAAITAGEFDIEIEG